MLARQRIDPDAQLELIHPGGRPALERYGLRDPCGVLSAERGPAVPATEERRSAEERDLVEEPRVQKGAQDLGAALDRAEGRNPHLFDERLPASPPAAPVIDVTA